MRAQRMGAAHKQEETVALFIRFSVYAFVLFSVIGAIVCVWKPGKTYGDWLVVAASAAGGVGVVLGAFFDIDPEIPFYLPRIPLTFVVMSYSSSILLLTLSGGLKGDLGRRVLWLAVLVLVVSIIFSVNNASR